MQQAMLKAWSALRAGAEVSDARAWLHRIVHHAALDALAERRGQETRLTEAVADGVPTQERVMQRFEVRRALAAVARLPGTQRQAFTLTAIEGRSGREAANTLGVSEGALRMMVHRARSQLRAAAGALVPLPLRGWLASVMESPAVSRLAEVRGGGGLAAAAAQAVALVGITGATVTGASLLSHPHPRTPVHSAPTAPAREAAAPSRNGAAVAPSGGRVRHALPAGAAPGGARGLAQRERRPGTRLEAWNRASAHGRAREAGGDGGGGAPSRHGAPAGAAPTATSAAAPDGDDAARGTIRSNVSAAAGPPGDAHPPTAERTSV